MKRLENAFKSFGVVSYLFGGVIDVLPIPKVFGHVSWYQVVFRHEWEKAPPTEGITRIAGFDVNVLQAVANLDVFRSIMVF